VDVQFTLAEAVTVLDPPLTEVQLRRIVAALGWRAAGYAHTGRPGHPVARYDWLDLAGLHAALVPYLRTEDTP
jgi:hypothetical protein